MKKPVVVLVLIILSSFVLAQEPRWTVSILPGYQLNAPSETTNYSANYWKVEKSKKEIVVSVDLNYKITEHYGLHLAYFHNDFKYDRTYIYRPNATYNSGPYRYESQVSIWEIGPEWQFKVWEKGELYLQLNLGRTCSSSDDKYWNAYYDQYVNRRYRNNTWIIGTAFGLRYFFTPNCGGAVQVAYHHLDDWWYSPLWDARAGVVFRF